MKKELKLKMICYIMLSFLMLQQVIGQGNTLLLPPSVLPPSPEASAIIKEGQLSVGLHTGAANTSIPLYAMKVGKFSLPISVNYSANGFKVDEIPSRVGMNWSLNAGGVITRVVQGKPDDQATRRVKPQNYYSWSDSLGNFVDNILPGGPDDAEPDEFRFNFLGYSGKFIIDDSGHIIQFPHSNLKIEVLTYYTEIRITATNGIIFKFGSVPVETTYGHSLAGSNDFAPATIVSWFLYQIVMPDGNQIDFTYQPISIATKTGVSDIVYAEKTTESGCPANLPVNPFYINPVFFESINSVNYHTYYLSGITASNGQSVSFDYEARPDNGGDNRLTTVTLNLGPLKKKYGFRYYDLPNNHITAYQNSFSEYNRRFFLDTISVTSVNSVDTQFYRFEYIDLDSLPTRLSYCQDNYGFYNGQVYNQNLLPSGYVGSWASSYTLGNRNANARYAMKGLLSKVIFPTGGYDQFSYEANETDIGGVRVNKIASYDPVAQQTINKFYAYNLMQIETSPEYAEEIYFKVKCPTDIGISNQWSDNYRQTLHSSSLVNLFLMDNSHIAYAKVIESSSSDYHTGRIEHDFETGGVISSTLVRGYAMKDIPNGYVTNLNGYETQTSYYDGSNHLVKQVKNHFETANPEIGYISLKARRRYDAICLNSDSADRVDIMAYQYISKWNRLDSTEILEYDVSTNAYNRTVTTNVYGSPSNIQPIETNYHNSKGELMRTTFKYPADFIAIAVYDTMVSRNIIEPVVERKTYRDTALLTTQKANYNFFNGYQAELSGIQESNRYNPLEDKALVDKYDIKGNVLEQHKANDSKSSYIWDYQYTYPIAVTTNADYTSVSFTSFEADGKGNWDYVSTGVDSINGAVTGGKSYGLLTGDIQRTGLESTRTYILTYWLKNNSGNLTINGGAGGTALVNRNGWTLFQREMSNVNSITVHGSSGTPLVDELRLYPKDAQMTTYTYMPFVGLTSKCDANNLITYYEYDSIGRLLIIRDQDKNILKNYQYTYLEVQ